MINQPAERTIILHYHLFKNAGTSVDVILKQNFGDKWLTREFPMNSGNNTSLVEEWIRDTPEAIAYSSHTMMGPIPQIKGVEVISFMLLRDPIERIRSAYQFERKQDADTWGAKLAKEHSFEGYVRTRLNQPGDRQCRNFQTYRLASLVPSQGTELQRALLAIEKLSVLGYVSDFSQAIRKLSSLIIERHPGFTFEEARANTSERLTTETGEHLDTMLRAANSDDLLLLESTYTGRSQTNPTAKDN